MPRKAATSRQNTLMQGVVKKKCDRAYHKPGSNKACAGGTCQHTCETARTAQCPHKWTVVYSVRSRQREQSFATLAGAEAFQVTLVAGKQKEGGMFTDPKAGNTEFLPLCARYIDGTAKTNAHSKVTYRSNFANPAVTALLAGRSVQEVAGMDEDVRTLLNVTLGHYSDYYRMTVRRIITATLDECVRKGIITRHALSGIGLGPRIVTAEQYESEHRGFVSVADETVRMLATGIVAERTDKAGRTRAWFLPGLGIAPWLQRTAGLRIREALAVRKADFKVRAGETRYLHLCWQASGDGRTLEPLKHRQAGEFRDVPVPDMIWDMVQTMPDGPLCPGRATAYLPYPAAQRRFAAIMAHLGVEGVTTHSLRHQFATEALAADPRQLAGISMVLGHDDVATTLKYYVHASADAEQRISVLMNKRWPVLKAA
jgi:hypothetical protein